MWDAQPSDKIQGAHYEILELKNTSYTPRTIEINHLFIFTFNEF